MSDNKIRQGKMGVTSRNGQLSMTVDGQLTAGEWIYAIETFKFKLLHKEPQGIISDFAKKLKDAGVR